MKSIFLRDTPIRTKLRIIILIVSALALFGAFSAFLFFQRASSLDLLSRQFEIMTQIVGEQSTAALEFAQQAEAEIILASLHAENQVMLAALYDEHGQLFARYLRENVDPALVPKSPQGMEGSVLTAGELHVLQPLFSAGEHIGTFYLRSDLAQVHEWFLINLAVVGFVFIIAVFAVFFLSAWLEKWITEPVLHLAGVMQAVTEQRNYSLRATKSGEDELGHLIDGFNDMLSQVQERDKALAQARDELEQRVQERTRELEERNRDLESFTYSVSHDLRAPLRAIDGFGQELVETNHAKLDAEGKHCIERMRAGTKRMAELIDGLLDLSRISRMEIKRQKVDLSALALEIAQELKQREPQRRVEFIITPGMVVWADSRLLRPMMFNLLENAWKYSRRRETARIELGVDNNQDSPVYFVRDNGAGFDMEYVDNLFGMFQRLHSEKEFEGTGIGLATVKRTLQLHGGRIWAQSEVGKGAVFFFIFEGKD